VPQHGLLAEGFVHRCSCRASRVISHSVGHLSEPRVLGRGEHCDRPLGWQLAALGAPALLLVQIKVRSGSFHPLALSILNCSFNLPVAGCSVARRRRRRLGRRFKLREQSPPPEMPWRSTILAGLIDFLAVSAHVLWAATEDVTFSASVCSAWSREELQGTPMKSATFLDFGALVVVRPRIRAFRPARCRAFRLAARWQGRVLERSLSRAGGGFVGEGKRVLRGAAENQGWSLYLRAGCSRLGSRTGADTRIRHCRWSLVTGSGIAATWHCCAKWPGARCLSVGRFRSGDGQRADRLLHERSPSLRDQSIFGLL